MNINLRTWVNSPVWDDSPRKDNQTKSKPQAKVVQMRAELWVRNVQPLSAWILKKKS